LLVIFFYCRELNIVSHDHEHIMLLLFIFVIIVTCCYLFSLLLIIGCSIFHFLSFDINC